MSDSGPHVSESLLAAAVKVDITPADLTGLNPIGGGSFSAVHDRLWLRALYLDDGATRAALITTDLIEVGNTSALRDRIEAEVGIPADHVIITASHTHSAPRLGRVTPGALAHDGGAESDRYTEQVSALMIDALRTAARALQPATLHWATGSVDVNVNRDTYIDGKWKLGFNPEGPSDKTLRLAHLTGADGETIALVMNYAVHSVTTLGSGELSADIAGAAQTYAEAELGGDAVVMWTLGSVGDQNPRIALGFPGSFTTEQIERAFAASSAQGILIGAEAVRAARAPAWSDPNARLHAEQRAIDAPTKQGVEVMSTMRQAAVDSVELRLSLLRIGDLAFAGVSGEVTTSVGAKLIKASPLAATVLVSMANDRIGYLPDDEAYSRGTFSANGAPIQQGHAADLIVDGLAEMIRAQQ